MPAHVTRMPSGTLPLSVVSLYLGARTSLDDQDVLSALSTSGVWTILPSIAEVQLSAHSSQSLIIMACDVPNLGLPTLVGVAPGFSLNLCGPTCLSGLGNSLVFFENTDSYLRRSAIIIAWISGGTSGHMSMDSRGICSSLYSSGFFSRYFLQIASDK